MLPARRTLLSLVACLGLTWLSAGQGTTSVGYEKPVDLPGLPNVIRVSEKLFSGGSPDGVLGFQSLRSLGIKTIISVDGARPAVTLAKKHGMRYVHLPIGYDGVTREQALALARAVRDLPGPVYIHCHHGKHRSPAAAAAIQVCLDKTCTVAQAIALMKRAGTDPRYIGLYAAPSRLERPDKQELDGAPADFPETAQVPAFAQAMVKIGGHWEHLVAIRQSGWKPPRTHPDLDPPHEALQLLEHYRELIRTAEVRKRPRDFQSWLADAEKAAAALESVLREGAKKGIDLRAAEKAFQQSRQLCVQCHGKYRDVPQAPR